MRWAITGCEEPDLGSLIPNSEKCRGKKRDDPERKAKREVVKRSSVYKKRYFL